MFGTLVAAMEVRAMNAAKKASTVASVPFQQPTEVFGRFDFGLSNDQEERARRLHAQSIIVDMMFAGPCGHRSFTEQMDREVRTCWDARHDGRETMFLSIKAPGRHAMQRNSSEYKECWDASGITAGSRNLEVGSYEAIADLGSHYTAEFDRLPWLIKALQARQICQAKAEGKHAAYFYCQPLAPVSMDLRLLDVAYDMGLRMLQLTYNNLDYVGAGCTERTNAGVSNFGIKVIERLNKLGVMVDVSHCGKQTTLDACSISEAPVSACHTSASALFRHVRAKADEELIALAGTGGIIGVYTLPCFLSEKREANIEVMLDHIEYIAKLVGWQHVGLGTDWPMQLPKWLGEAVLRPLLVKMGFREEDIRVDNLIGFDDYRDFPNITRGLVKRGFSDEQIRGILGENVLHVFEKVCG